MKTSKKLRRKLDLLDRRVKSWQATTSNAKNAAAYRKPGSMKGRV